MVEVMMLRLLYLCFPLFLAQRSLSSYSSTRVFGVFCEPSSFFLFLNKLIVLPCVQVMNGEFSRGKQIALGEDLGPKQ